VDIVYFGERRLLAAVHRPARARGTGVLLCNPFGEEASRAHRSYRVLATQLERAGFPSMRFDYSGTGDSAGDSRDATVEAWLADITAAAAHLRQATGVARLAVVGLRFGAAMASLARLPMNHLVMWDPIASGSTYLRELAVQHRAYMREELGPAWRDRLVVRADGSPSEALGTPIGDELARALNAIEIAANPIAAEHVTVVTTRPAELAALRTRLPVSTRWLEVANSAAWNSDAALNAMVVPMDIVRLIVARIEETCP